MKRFLLVAAGVSLVLPDIALAYGQAGPPKAQDRPGRPGGGGDRPGRPGGGGAGPGNPGRPGGGATIQPIRPGPGQPGGPAIQPPRPDPGNGVRPPRPNPGNGIRPPRPNPGGGGIRPPRPNPGPGVRPPHRPGAGKPPNFRPIRGPAFSYPRGYRYRRWAIGLFLPSLFLSNYYYYDNWAPLGVGAPPPGYRWVRYGPDLLLVQIGTRRIVDVIYGAFY
jgi:hypothetical protein